MKIVEKITDRYNIMILFVFLVIIFLSFGLANLTIVEGEKHRAESERKRLKTVPIEAARGEIRDRYGRLLAGNKTSFTIQIAKDEIQKNRKNEILLKLYTILEEEGEHYIDEFPIDLNVIEIRDRTAYIEEKYANTDEENTVTESGLNIKRELAEIIIENKLLNQLIDNYYTHNTETSKYKYSAGRELFNVVENELGNSGIKVDSGEFQTQFAIDDQEVFNLFCLKQGITQRDPKEVIIKAIETQKSILESTLENPIMRKFVFEILQSNGLDKDFELIEYSYDYDSEYRQIKRTLMANHSKITMDSIAVDDFYNIVLDSCIYELMLTKNDKEILVGEELLKKLQEEQNIPIELGKDINGRPAFKFIDGKKRNFLIKAGLNVDTSAIDAILLMSKEKEILKDFVASSEIKFYAQKAMLNKGINPRISISNESTEEWNYVPILEKNNWTSLYRKVSETATAEESFEIISGEDYYDIDKSLSKYEKRLIFTGIDQLQKTGYLAYYPINISYDVKDVTVSRIMENEMALPAVKVTAEPIRYYPEGTTAAHLLGYLGKISQQSEIDKYIKNGDGRYTPNDIIGKTGIEQSYEKWLKGTDGKKQVEVDIGGNIIDVKSVENATPGNNVYMSIDGKLQQVAEESLKHSLDTIQAKTEYKSVWGNYSYARDREHFKNATSGATVAIDVKTGKVLALASYPAYDPNLFATGITTKNWNSLLPKEDKDVMAPRPLYNIALQTAIQPGSIFKMITAVAALDKGMNPYQKINSLGYIEYGNSRFGCWYWNGYGRMHGPTDMIKAIQESCNYYFYTVVLGENMRTSKKLGLNVNIYDIIKIANEFGLNDKTGIEINIPNERSGGVPNPVTKALYSKRKIANFLNQNLEFYLISDEEISEEHRKKIIEEISGWAELEKTPSYNTVYKELKKLGLNPDKSNGKENSLADTIRYRYLYDAGWRKANTLNVSIGQGENAYTPIQMANYIATLANDGLRHKVSTIDVVKDFENRKKLDEPIDEAHQIEVSNRVDLDIIKKAMNKVTTDGTARSIFRNFPVEVAAKTGTAEKDGINPITGESYDSYGWFVSFAPYDDPEIAVATVIFQAGHGGSAGPMSRDIMAQYLGLNYKESGFDFKASLEK